MYFDFVKNIVPFKRILQYFFERFLGKYCKIDLDLANFNGDEVILRDLDLNCTTLNETIQGKTPLKFIKCFIGAVKINFQIGVDTQVQIHVEKIDIIMIPIDLKEGEMNESQTNQVSDSPEQSDVKKEGIIDRLVGSLLQNLELTITNIAVRIQSRDNSNELDEIPTILIRVDRVEYTKGTTGQNDYVQELHCLLHGKKVKVGELSIHLLRDRQLNANEFDKPGEFNAALFKLEFPFQYPLITHPSTFLLFKGPQYALEVNFKFLTASKLEVDIRCGNFEAMVSQHQLVLLSQTIATCTKESHKDSQMSKSSLDISLSQSLLMESKHFRQNFSESLKVDSELMKSIDDIVLLNDSYGGFPIQKISSSQIHVKCEVKIKLIRFALLCHQEADRVEDKVFKIFQRDGSSTSAEIYYEMSTKDVGVMLKKSPGKLAAVFLTTQQFQIKSYLRGSKVVNACLDESLSQYHSMEDSGLYKTAYNEDKFEIVNESQADFEDSHQFEVQELMPAPMFDYASATLLEVQKFDSKIKADQIQFVIDKVFLHVNSTDLLMALYLSKLLAQKSEEVQTKISAKKKASAIEIKGELKGVEVELYLHRTISYQALKEGRLPLPEAPVFGKTSVGLNFAVKLCQTPKSDFPVITLSQVNLNAIQKGSRITLMSIESVEVSQIVSMVDRHPSQNTIIEIDIENEEDDVSPIQFIKNSSSNQSEGPMPLNDDFQLPASTSTLKVVLKGVCVEIDGRDIDSLSTFIMQQELALKHTSNIMDIFSLLSSSVQLKPALLPTSQISIEVSDFCFLLLSGSLRQRTSSQPLVELNLNSTSVDLLVGGSREISCIEVKVMVKQILLLDLFSEEMEVYNPSKDEFIQLSTSQQMKGNNFSSYMDKLLSGKAILHESKPTHTMLVVDCKICFIEEGSMQQRVDISFVQTEDIQQLFADLGEMKVNPMQLTVMASLKNFNIYFTNRTLSLGNQLQKTVLKLQNRLQYAKQDQKANIKPRQICQIDDTKKSTFADLRLENCSCAYQPVLKLVQFQEVLGRPVDKKWNGQPDEKRFKSNQVVVLRTNRTILTTNTIDHHNLKTDQIQVFFLSENTPSNLENWVNYSKSGDRLTEMGFVQIFDLSNKKSIIKKKQVKLTIQSIRVGMCSDLLSEILGLQRVAQVAFASDQSEDLLQSTLLFPIKEDKQEIPADLENSTEEVKSSDSQQLANIANEESYLIVVGGINQMPQYINNDSKSPSSVFPEKVDFTQRIEKDYFRDTNTQSKNIRKQVHRMPDSLRDPQLEASFEISMIKIMLFKGSDLDFKLGVPVVESNNTQKNLIDKSLTRSTHLLSSSQNQQLSFDAIDQNYIGDLSLLELANEMSRQASTSARRARTTQRDARRQFQISFSEICATLRVFNQSEANKETKTITVSIGNVQISLYKDLSNELQILESPYCYRQRNLIELSCILENDQQTNAEELQLVLSLRPTKIFVSQAPIDFVTEYLKGVKMDSGQSQPLQQIVATGKAGDSKIVQKPPLRIRSIVIKESEIQISVSHLQNITLGNFINFDGFTFKINHYQLVTSGQDAMSIEEAFSKVIGNYLAQAKRLNTLYQVLSSYTPFRSIGKGVYNILAPVYKPLIGVRYGGVGVVIGLSEGLQDLSGYLQEESYGWTMYFIHKLY